MAARKRRKRVESKTKIKRRPGRMYFVDSDGRVCSVARKTAKKRTTRKRTTTRRRTTKRRAKR